MILKPKFTKQNICVTCGQWKMVMPRARRCEDCTRKNDNNTKVAAQKKRMQNPEYSAAYRAKKSAEYIERMKDPLLKAKYLEQKRVSYDKRMSDPKSRAVYLAQHNTNYKKRLADPVYKAQQKIKDRESQRKSAIKKNQQALLALKLNINSENNDED